MCGIFGYANYRVSLTVRQIIETLLCGLQKVEYRGYDSAGLCIDGTKDDDTSNSCNAPVVIKSVGNINALQKKIFCEEMLPTLKLDSFQDNHIGIAHTRWATHGAVCERNCHPQQSNRGEFTIVHNGIMTNFVAVKTLLMSQGFDFTSDTDTEVIAVLAEYLYSKKGIHDFDDLAHQITHFVDGAYALLVKSTHFPGELIACRKGSPLVIGIRQIDKQGNPQLHGHILLDVNKPVEVFFASDSSSFAEYTTNVVYLEDGDVAHYAHGSLCFYNALQSDIHSAKGSVLREIEHLEFALESLSKGMYAHFMLKEVCEQPDSISCSMRGRIDFIHNKIHLGGFTSLNIRNILHSRRLLMISCGTSLHSCIAVRPLFEELLTLPVSIENASDFIDRNSSIHRDDTCFFVSQSGETADVLMALQMCRNNGALCVGVTNVVGSSLSRISDFGSHLNAGTEVGVASTKAYTSQIVVLSLIALLLSEDSLRVQERRQEIMQSLAQLPSKISDTLRHVAEPIQKLAGTLKDASSILVLGRGYDYATALEAALKIKEVSYVHTEGINSGELKHGSLALVDEKLPVLAVCSYDKHFQKSKTAIQQVNARKGNVVVLSNIEDVELVAASRELIRIPKVVDCLQCVLNVIPFQLLAYHMALLRGNNIDCPRNLAKSVTV